MSKTFNVSGACNPDRHFIVDLESRLREIRSMIDRGEYFVISRARQYGKTTLLRALAGYLKEDYQVVSLDFQNIESGEYMDGSAFAHALAREVNKKIRRMAGVPSGVEQGIANLAGNSSRCVRMAEIFSCFSEWCECSRQPVVLIVDEIDTAANNQIFLDFLAQLRAAYLGRDEIPAFRSVILAGVYDVRNIKRKIRSDEEHMENSPWNIAADFDVEMSFFAKDIEGMLRQYEDVYHTGMDIEKIAGLLYDYTSGYPYLVSRICKLIDERIAGTAAYPDKAGAWTEDGYLAAVKMLLEENNPLFDSLINKINQYPELKSVIWRQLFQGQPVAYAADDSAVRNARMFGLVKTENGTVRIANRIFETRLYNYFLTLPEVQGGELYQRASLDKNQFVQKGQLDMKRVLEKFVEHFDEIYGDRGQKIYEEDGRRYFMLYLKPIINGVGNYYVEARTRNQERTDLIIDYLGTQFIIELKLWRGNAYNERGETQLIDYLEYYHLQKGYMLSFNFNQKKETGVKEIILGDKILIEVVI